MWSKSNTLSVIYVGLSTLIVCTFACGFLSSMHLATHYEEIATAAALILLGFLFSIVGADVPVVMVAGTLGVFVALTVTQDPLIKYMTLAALLFSIGMYGMLTSRNAIRVLISIELMINAVNINFATLARYVDPMLVRGQVFAIFILTVAAAEAAVGLAIVLAIYRNMSTIDMERFNLLKW